MTTGRLLLVLFISTTLFFACSDLDDEQPQPFSQNQKLSTEAIEDQVISIEMALNSFQTDPNVIWKNLSWEMGDLTGETEAAYKNAEIIYLKEKSHSSFGATIQEFYVSAGQLLYTHEYRVNMKCHEGHIVCIQESKHYFSKNQLINGLERRTKIPHTQLDRYDKPYLEAALDEIPFINLPTDNPAVYQSDVEKFNRLQNQWEASLN